MNRVYSLGYQQGVMDCTKTPKMLQEKIMNTILVGQGVSDMNHSVQTIGEWEIKRFASSREDQQFHGVAQIGQKVIQAAAQHVQEKLLESMEKVRAKLPADMADHVVQQHYLKDQDCAFWYDAGLRLMGEGDRPWEYVFIKTNVPNAFVTEMLPQRFFMTTGLMDLADHSADEIAFVLAHEVSHLVLGHVSQANRVDTVLKTVEVLLLSIDPTSGVLALFFIGGLAALRKALSAAHSRESEREADDLGVEIAARACFDTATGAQVMKKMHHLSSLASSGGSSGSNVAKVASLYDSHPPSEERFQSLQLKAQEFNKDKHTHCHGLVRRLFASMWNKPSQHMNVDEAKAQMATKAPVS